MAGRPVVTINESGWPVLDVGRCVHPITIWQQAPSSPPAIGVAGPALEWQPVATAMAAIEIVRGIDVIRGGQVTTQLYATVTFWWQPGILSNMHVTKEDGSTFIIQSVENVEERNVVLRLNCLGLGANE
jgi:hypothetical protein